MAVAVFGKVKKPVSYKSFNRPGRGQWRSDHADAEAYVKNPANNPKGLESHVLSNKEAQKINDDAVKAGGSKVFEL